MKKLATVIADDIPNDRELIRKIILDYCPELEIIAETGTITETFEVICQQQPDLVLLDIEFNEGKTGFNLIDDLVAVNALSCQIIFVSGHLNKKEKYYALTALEYAALGCLHKPIEIDKMRQVVEQALIINRAHGIKILQEQYEVGMNLILTGDFTNASVIIETTLNTYQRVATADILYLTSVSTVTEFVLLNKPKFRGRKLIGKYEFLTTKDPYFLRVHQSYIVNLRHFKDYNWETRQLTLIDGSKVNVSRSKDRELRRILEARNS